LDASTHVWHFTERQLFLSPLTPHLSNHDQSGVYTETYCQSDAFVLFETGMQGSYRLYNSQPGADSSLGIVFVCLRIAKIEQETIPEQLGDVPIVALDNVSTHPLIRTHHVPVLFGVELAGEARGVHEVTEQHGELAPFRLWRSGGGWRRGKQGRG
jgi:hypothetical protein